MNFIISLLLPISSAMVASAQEAPAGAAAPIQAEPSAEQGLKSWLFAQPAVRRKIDSAVKRLAAADPRQLGELRDAVASPRDASKLREEINKAEGERKKRLLTSLPGMRPKPFGGCRSLEDCAAAPTQFKADRNDIEDAVVALVRPWLHLQSARGRSVAFDAVGDSSDRLMKIRLDGMPDVPLAIHLSPSSDGKFLVRLRGKSDAARTFETERRIALAWAQGR